MSLSAGKILKISITLDSKKTILEEIQKYLDQKSDNGRRASKREIKPFVIVTPNPEQIVYAQSHPRFCEILNRADVSLPDGIGIMLAAKFLRGKTAASADVSRVVRIPGVEFMEDLARVAAERGDRIGLIGGFDDLAVKTYECLHTKYPRLTGWGENGPDLTFLPEGVSLAKSEVVRMADRVARTKTHFVFVGLGAPKQEGYILSLLHEMEKRHYTEPLVLMAVGGSFDILTGRLKRAPLFIRSIGFEWAWRLFQEPWRWRRQLALLKFITLVVREKIVTSENI